MSDATSFFGGQGLPYATFHNIGDSITGTIVAPPVQQQMTEVGTGKPLTWDDGKPRMQLVITLQTDQRDPDIENDNGQRRVFVTGTSVKQGGGMKGAFQRAGVRDLPVGGTLTVTYTHDGEPAGKGFNPPKQYKVEFTPPNPAGEFLGGAATSDAEIPQGMDAATWASLTPEVRAALGQVSTNA